MGTVTVTGKVTVAVTVIRDGIVNRYRYACRCRGLPANGASPYLSAGEMSEAGMSPDRILLIRVRKPQNRARATALFYLDKAPAPVTVIVTIPVL